MSVIGEYYVPGGQVLYSEPSKMKMANKTKSKILYSINWIKAGLFGGKCKSCKLIITTDTGSIPEMFLVYKTDAHIPMRLDDPKIGILYTVEQKEDNSVNKKIEFLIDENQFAKLPANAELRLMLSSDDDAMSFEIQTSDISSLKKPN